MSSIIDIKLNESERDTLVVALYALREAVIMSSAAQEEWDSLLERLDSDE